ncbi:hypothetical protein BO78DRAFT_403530 [Aspergillus sclerotiicarbonarius CBS 121057]|uniref:Zn(2)-C6 fungal-type domain-containing protein n=1 Tax=Aspergillus sclerotiicarbonarius (strain CBS 121057 / IBT 28362) TaxID=1448318 RepID=A0A319F5E3_ASPSB|nr:hypothetical protein BO78DRAFT_403530 [Aspergillus sclerotiicarbonarius CBS 121057]
MVGVDRQPLKRTRIVHACEQCRARKVKCNGEDPCITCWQHNQSCRYREAPRTRGRSCKKLKLKEPTPLSPVDETASPSFTRSNDIGTRKVASARTGGNRGPARYSPEEYRQQLELRAGIAVSNSQTGSFQFYGPSSHFCLIQRIYQRMKRQSHGRLLDQPRTPVPTDMGESGLGRFMFAAGSAALRPLSGPMDSFLSKDMGYQFITAYFTVIHPHMPVLDQRIITRLWDQLWDAPTPGREVKSKDLVYMTLALGARTMAREDTNSAQALDSWADHFWAQSNDYSSLFQEPSLKGIHLLLLKAMYAFHGMRPNDAYLFLGHATRCVLALGLNRSQVANGPGPITHKLRVTFWSVYFYERLCSFSPVVHRAFWTRISTSHFRKTSPTATALRSLTPPWATQMVSGGIFSLANLQALYDQRKVDTAILECDASLQEIQRTLPPYLHFFARERPRTELWREIQCTHLGLAFHMIKMMIRRPALVYSTVAQAQGQGAAESQKLENLQPSIDLSIQAAKEMIDIAHSAIMERAMCIRNDASVANYIVSACVTLLYHVLDPLTIEHAKNIFSSVERGIHCLDQMEHHGPITEKALSMDIMKCAKDALLLSTIEKSLEEEMTDNFPWLNLPRAMTSSRPASPVSITCPIG